MEHAQESFKRPEISLQKVLAVAKEYPDQLKLSCTALDNLKSVDEVWDTLKQKEHTSWFNSEVVEDLVKHYGDVNDRENLREFQEDRKKLLFFMGDNEERGKKSIIVLKLEEEFQHFTEEKLKAVCMILCDLLNTTTCPLKVREGCVEITLSILAVAAEDFFPLSPAMKMAFLKAFPTLISISCGKNTETFEVSTILCFFIL